MTAAILALTLAAMLIASALFGPHLLRRAAPTLSTVPRVASYGLIIGAVLWIAALVVIGPLVAWFSSGPAWLPAYAAQVCSRCLAAATPFTSGGFSLDIPAVVPLALPALGGTLVTWGLLREVRLSRIAYRAASRQVLAVSRRVMVQGVSVQVVPDVRSEAFSLPRTYGGVVVSQGMLDTLDEREVAAVLAHEQAHVRQHHHVLVLILRGVTHFVRWVPLIAAIRDAVPHYLEIAADHAASSVAGKRALATALLKLSMPASAQSALLYAAGSDRIRHLVGVQSTPVSIALSVAAVMFVTVLVSVVSAVHWPYIFAIVSGC